MNNIKGNEVRYGKQIYLDSVYPDLIEAVSGVPLSITMLEQLHDGTSALVSMSARQVMSETKEQSELAFSIRLQSDQSCIGVCALDNISWSTRHAQLIVKILDEAHYASDVVLDVIQTMLQFVYWEANLNRIGIYCSDDHSILIDALEQAGFTNEGRMRQHIYRNSRYFDRRIFSILQREWSQ